jgi:PTH1 family peptidyl-tRNA hydrolase
LLVRIIFGLGNPGSEYASTRHNIGYRVLDRVAHRDDVTVLSKTNNAEASSLLVEIDDAKLLLVKPALFMNRSGIVVKRFIQAHGIPLDCMLVVADDVYLNLGQIRFRRKGGGGGHKGLLSIITALDTEEFPRLRIGIGPLPPAVTLTDYVLDALESDEEISLTPVFTRCVQGISTWVKRGIDSAMNEFNTRE